MVPRHHQELVVQMVRFGLTGGLLTILVAGGYWFVATFLGVEPMLSLTLNYLVFTALGYALHSNFSFRGHGARDRPAARTARFFTVNTLGFAGNQFFVWFIVKHHHFPVWWSVIPILFVTPLVTFTLQRRWVFG